MLKFPAADRVQPHSLDRSNGHANALLIYHSLHAVVLTLDILFVENELSGMDLLFSLSIITTCRPRSKETSAVEQTLLLAL